MRVAFDARHLQTVARHRGIGRYARNLLTAWAEDAPPDVEFVLLVLSNFPKPAPQPWPRRRKELRVRRLRRPELAMLVLDAVFLPMDLLGMCDVYHSLQLSLPAVRVFPVVVTVHDLAPLRWPDHYLRWPHVRLGHWLQYGLASRADAVIVPSQATREDVVDRLGVDDGRVHVIPEAVDPSFAPPTREEGQEFVRERLGVPPPYALYVGQFDPRKNMPALARAFAIAAASDPSLRLVVAGAPGPLARFLHDALRESGAPRERVVTPGYVDDATLAALYAGAEALVHPALLEGFGLTPLEAMAAGTPVVAYDAPGVSELVADAGVLVPLPDEGSALGEALRELLRSDERRARLAEAGRARARLYSWRDAAARTLDVYRAVAP